MRNTLSDQMQLIDNLIIGIKHRDAHAMGIKSIGGECPISLGLLRLWCWVLPPRDHHFDAF